MSFFHFSGTPCFQHSNYVFYKSFRYKVGDESRVLSLGDFFFLKILQDIPVCIGEIELLWEDKASNQLLSSLRLYFKPEHTQIGRQEDTGEDEMLVLGERLTVRLDDLLPLMLEDLKWMYGHSGSRSTSSCKGRVKEENGLKSAATEEKAVKEEKEETDDDLHAHSGAANVAIMSYPRYCRYRAIMRRLEGCENEWLHLAVVMAIGGFSGRLPGCRVMFCKETFYHPEIDDLDIRMDHMFPALKNRPKKLKFSSKLLGRKDSQHDSDSTEELFANITPSISTSSRPRRSTEPSDLNEDKVSAQEQAFLIGLHKFMHDAKMPIGRIPYLGFKQIDLYVFYRHADKLGGYDSITTKRMWKQLYDKMGGNISNTSAATCTRKHYERLLLPYERHLRKMKGGGKIKKRGLSSSISAGLLMKKEEKHRSCQKETALLNPRKSEKKEVLIKEENEQVEEVVTRMVTPQNVDVNKEASPKRKGEVVESRSTPDWKNGGAEPLEVPNIRPRQLSSSKEQNSPTAIECIDQEIPLLPSPFASLGLTEQHLQAAGLPGAVLPAEFGAAEGTVIPNTNLMYRGGYLVPIHQAQMLQHPWGIIPQPPPSLPLPPPPPLPPLQNSHHKQEQGLLPEEGRDIPKLASATATATAQPSPAHISKTNQSLATAATISSMDAVMLQNTPGLIAGTKLPAAHSNTPYQPSPYHLTDHIQKPGPSLLSSSSSQSSSGAHHSHKHNSHQLKMNKILTNSSQNIISLLHPKPTNLKSRLILPPAPVHLYLHPSNSNISPLPPTSGIPPAAHSLSRKRLYPFESPSTTASTFPSPDMVLDRIKSSTTLPNSTPTRPLSQRQQYDSPRDIFKQNAQTFAGASQNPGPTQPKKSFLQSDSSGPNKRPTTSKSKTPARKNFYAPPVSPYGAMPSVELQIPTNGASSGYGKNGEQMKMASSSASGSNGFMHRDHSGLLSQGVGPPGLIPHLVSSVPHLVSSVENPMISGKDGRLTSALFGAQFTAMPRPTKQAESPSTSLNSSESSSSSAAHAAAAAMSLSPLLHPAFMNSFLPPGVSPSPLNPQLQMYAGAYGASPAQLAAYEELLRQNGYGSYLSPGTHQAKVGKKN